MPYQKILKHLYLGDQFANEKQIPFQVKISPNFYCQYAQNETAKKIITKQYVLTKDILALNLVDSHDPDDFNDEIFAVGVKFIDERIAEQEDVFVHCQLGLSRSPSLIFIYLVSKKMIQKNSFVEALKEFLSLYYPYMKLNYGTYHYLETNFPFKKVTKLAAKEWEELKW